MSSPPIMPITYAQEHLDKIYDKLPTELQEAIFSVETAEGIDSVCATYGITDNRVGEIATRVGHVLMGIILPQEFEQILKEEISLPKILAQAIARDINRLIFYPVKPILEQLHQIEIKVTAKVVAPHPQETRKKSPEKPSTPDAYQESIE